MTIREKTMTGMYWSFIESSGSQGAQFLNLAASIVACGVLVGISGLIGSFYGEPRLTLMLQFLAFGVVLGFRDYLNMKQLVFGTLSGRVR